MPAEWRGVVAFVEGCVTDSEVALLLDWESLGLGSSHVSHASMLESTDGATEGVLLCFDAFLTGAGVISGTVRPASDQNAPVVSINGGSSGTCAGDGFRGTGDLVGFLVSVDVLLADDARDAWLPSR